MHATCFPFIELWFYLLTCHCQSSMLNVTLQLARAGRRFGMNQSTFQQLYLLKLCHLYQIKHDVSMNYDPSEAIWLVY